MNRIDQNINKDMIDSDLIDVESVDFSNDQTWLYVLPNDSGQNIDILDWYLSCDWPVTEDEEYLKAEKELYAVLDRLSKNDTPQVQDRHKFDSRTFIRPKKAIQRPSIHSIVEKSMPPNKISNQSSNQSANKYLTYNKYTMPGPVLRLKTFNVDTNTENSSAVKEFSVKRKSLVHDEDPQLEDSSLTIVSDSPDRQSEHTPTKPINIDLSQPAHNLFNTFNKGVTSMMSGRSSMNMYQSGESLMRMSPPSLVSSLLMENSGTFNPDDGKKSISSQPQSGNTPGRESVDPMMTSMTLSILDEKDMSTSFLSQTTYPDHDSLIDSLPPSLVSSVNSSYVVNTSKPMSDSRDSNIFSSATFTHLEQSERLLSARPRCQMFNSYTKRESGLRNSFSYTKSREEGCQIDTTKILNEITDKPDCPKPNNEMCETVTLHYSNKLRKNSNAEKENLNSTFEKDDAFYKDMEVQKNTDPTRNSLNMTMDKQELNEIIQARQKLSLARKQMPTDEKLPNQLEISPQRTINNVRIPASKQSNENASELLSRIRTVNGNSVNKEQAKDLSREPPKRSATFKKITTKSSMDTTVVYVKDNEHMIDINSATLNLLDSGEKTLKQEEWGSQERAMIGSSESTDTGTFSSSSPPESVPDAIPTTNDPRSQIASTPLVSLKIGSKCDMLNLHETISPIYDVLDDKSYILSRNSGTNSPPDKSHKAHNVTVVNCGTMVKKSVKRDILAPKVSPEKKYALIQQKSMDDISPASTASYVKMAPPTNLPRKTALPASKLRLYSSHKELNRIPPAAPGLPVTHTRVSAPRGGMVRRSAYASNPALSPSAPQPPAGFAPPIRRDSYTLSLDQAEDDKKLVRPTVTNPPALIRQGTETIKRERPQSQLVAPKDQPTTRLYSIASASQLRVGKQPAGPMHKFVASECTRPASGGADVKASALPRPSRLPAPRRTLRPPSVYTVAPTADLDHY